MLRSRRTREDGWRPSPLVRGIAARQPQDPNRIGNLLGLGVPGLALAAIIGGMIAEPWRGRFLDAAQAGAGVRGGRGCSRSP